MTRPKDEEGAVAATVAILLVVLIMFTALVLDIGSLRMDRRESQLAVDLAATAAFFPLDAFDPEAPGAGRSACENAWDYIEANLDGLNTTVAVETPGGGAPCSSFSTAAVCDPATSVPVTSRVVADPYVIELTTPVLSFGSGDTSSDALMARVENADGTPCERFGVRVHRTRDYFFANVSGFLSGETQPSAVSRYVPGEAGNFASLIVLEQADCVALDVSGQGGVTVQNYEGDPTTTADDVPGEITVDSVATGDCTPSKPFALHVRGTNQGYVRAEGEINQKALQGPNPGAAYEVGDLTTTVSDGGPKLAVIPRPEGRELREVVDHLVNCTTGYTVGQANPPWHPQHETLEGIADCDDAATLPPFVSRLRAGLETGDLTTNAAWTVFPDDFAGQSCKSPTATLTPTTPAVDLTTGLARTVGERLFINCGTGGNDTFTPTSVTISDVDFIVSQNRIQVAGGSTQLTIAGDSPNGSVLYLRNGDLTKGSQGRITFTNVFVYVDNLADGFVSIGAGSPTVTWRGTRTSAVDSERQAFIDRCHGTTSGSYVFDNPVGTSAPALPPAACFGPVALWSNGTGQHLIGGQGLLNIAGTFFTPNANRFELKGDSTQSLDAAQFFSRYINISGQGDITMTPNPFTTLPTSAPTSALIR